MTFDILHGLQVKSAIRIFAGAGIVAALMATCHAAPIHWTNSTASYNNALNWDPNSVPMATPNQDNAINDNGTNNVVQINVGDPDWFVWDIRAGDAANTAGAFEQNGQTVDIGGWFRLAVGSNSFGVYDLNDGTLDVTGGRLNVAEWGTGVFNMNGGMIRKSGDVFSLGDAGFHGGDPSTGIVNQVAGTVTSSSELWIGQFSGGVGEYNLSGSGTIVMSNWLAIGRADGTGVLNLSGNASITKAGGGGNITFAGIGASTGTLNQDGGAVTNTVSQVWLGESGTGTWNLNSGIAYVGFLQVGRNSGAVGTFNLNGGELTATEITSGAGAIGTFNFNGGTLAAGASNPDFLHGVTTVDLQAGGAVIDTRGFDIGISSSIVDNLFAGGGLTKTGAGTLEMTGNNSYPGTTTVSEGRLATTTASFANGDYLVADDAGLAVNVVGFANAQLFGNNLTLGTSGTTTLDMDLGAFGNPTAAPISLSGALAVNSTVTVNVTDAMPEVGQFPLIQYGTKSGSGSFVVGSLPIGVQAAIVDNTANKSIDLNITSVSKVRWDGTVNGDWDIGMTTNWVNPGTMQPATYQDGIPVVLDDNAIGTTDINLTTTVTPNGVSAQNSLLEYTLSGSGKISGAGGVVKQGTATLNVLNTGGNDYTGPTRVEGGTLNVTNLANGGSPSSIGASSSSPENLVLGGGTFGYSGPAVSIDRGYSVTGTNNAIRTESNLALSGQVSPAVGSVFLKTGPATLAYTKSGTNHLASGGGGGFAAYNVIEGTVLLDGTAGDQTNYNTGEFWIGGTTNSGAALVMSNSTLNSSSWVALGRGNGTSNFLSSIRLENSTLRVTGGGFSAGFDADLPLNQGVQILAHQEVTLNGNSAIEVANGPIFLAERRGATATVLLNDNSRMMNSANAGVGVGAGGSLTGSTGSVEIADSALWRVGQWLSIGNEGGTGSMVVKDSGSLFVGIDLNVTDVGASTGTLTVQDNAQVGANNIFVGKDNNASGVFTITNNATVISSNNLTMARFYTGDPVIPTTAIVNLSGGSLAVSSVQGTITSGTSYGTFNFNGGTLVARNPIAGNFMSDLAAINVMSGGATIDSDTYNISIVQPLLDGGGGGGLTKLGSGALYLNGTNTYTGTTVVSAGTLGGTGVLGGPVSVAAGGTLAPATSIGTLTINNTLTLAGDTVMEISRDAGSPASDLVTGVTTLTYGGTLTVANIGTNALQVGDTFQLFSAATINPDTFTTMNLPVGYTWDTSQLNVDGSISVTGIAVIVEFDTPEVSDGNVILSGMGGDPDGTFFLRSSTNVALPLGSWPRVSTNMFDSAGNFNLTNAIDPANPLQFYLIETP